MREGGERNRRRKRRRANLIDFIGEDDEVIGKRKLDALENKIEKQSDKDKKGHEIKQKAGKSNEGKNGTKQQK